jgi:hypothetical protein
VATIPGQTRDESYFLVEREIVGTTARFVELMEDERISEASDNRFLDAHLAYVGDNSSSVIAVSGLDHLEGEEVSIVVDGGVHVNQTVQDGSVTLDNRASVVVVGLNFPSLLTTMRSQAGAQMGTAHGKLKRVASALIHFYKSAGCEFGVDEDGLDVLPWRKTTDFMDRAPDLIDGIVEVTLPGGYERPGRVVIKQTNPLPLTVLSIVPTVDTSEF